MTSNAFATERYSVLNGNKSDGDGLNRRYVDNSLYMNVTTDDSYKGVRTSIYDEHDETSWNKGYSRQDKALLAGPSLTGTQTSNRSDHQRHMTWAQLIHKYTPFTYLVSVADCVVFIYQLVRMSQLTGSAFQTEPYFNPMLGPSTYSQISIGSRFEPCMLPEAYLSWDVLWPCPNSTTTDTQVCSLMELCGLPTDTNDLVGPAQSWRLLSACFLHAGFIHIILNLLLQLTIGREVERLIGTIRYMAIYLLSGISGNLFGVNFAGNGVSSCGASGALFGAIAVNLLLFTLHIDRAKVAHYRLVVGVLVFEIVACLVLGLLPGLDNFAHIGGFISGLLLGIAILENPRFIKRDPTRTFALLKSYSNCKTRLFWCWTCLRVVCLALLAAWFIGLGISYRNGGGDCSWCRYLSCLPVNGWCESTELSTTSG